ncbi:MAG: hypothetical protein ABIJ20_02930 [Nanoarchaeota archaeon]|nr:hypothetical protein [Nanoarchaeota archaeon]MBU1445490.1 hypothetical protein [Nanoarchaeota archaeon]MBU2406584.1 hypothetical protein [Nanoarchaeota archaeon]MBU2420698.1 hypothetical protein [Nanoarchaeota archaeon]MBU2475661.1 hypothetical protein [Nanoarchaeota archaeon]
MLQLNEPTLNFKEFYGKNIDQMPLLIAEGRTPLSVSGLMRRRLEVSAGSDDIKSAWRDNYFDTGDAIVYHPDGRVKIVLDSEHLRDLSPDSKLSASALVLEDGVYDQLEGQEFSKAEIQKYAAGESLSLRQAKTNPVWKALARDSELLNAYATEVFGQAKERFSYDKNMGIYVAGSQSEPTMRLWYVGRLYDRSYANGSNLLGGSSGRLVGVAPEAHATEGKPVERALESRIACAISKGQKFERKDGLVYTPVAGVTIAK